MGTASLDPAEYVRRRVPEAHGAFSWNAAAFARLSPAERASWQQIFRARFHAALGGLFAWEKPDPEVSVEEAQQFDGYRREAMTFTTRPGLRAFGYLLIPDDCPPGRPGVLCLPGHGRGVDGIVGIAEDGSQRPLPSSAPEDGGSDGYSGDFALQCVAQGWPTFALEQISFGRRRTPAAVANGPGASSCSHDSTAALMLGETVSGWRVWDAQRALDILAARPEVDAARLATMGISGGGLTSLFTAALDERVSAAVVSGYFNTWAASVLSIPHCVDNYAPGLLPLCEMPDLAALVAPRALFTESGRDDPIFPLPAFEDAVRQAREIYTAFGSPERFDAAVFAGGHRFDGAAAFAFLRAQFGAG